MILKTVVIDDESRALALMVDYVKKVPSLELTASFQNAIEALEFLNSQSVDILLLDIQMPDITGLELLDNLQNQPLVIFTTAYPEYAVEGFQLDAVDYLVKPIMFPRFLKAINKAINQAKLLALKHQQTIETPELETVNKLPANPGYIFVKVETRWERIQLSDITYIEGCGDYVAVHLLNNKKILSLQTLTQMMTRLSGKNFVRVHRSFIINLQHVDTIEKDHVLICNHDITISKSYRQDFLKLVNNKGRVYE
jgi:DNA-binding LytR/AlgR family response regulator